MKHVSPNEVTGEARVKGPTRRALAKQQTRNKVLAAARALFSEHGYEGATIRDIAAAAGMSTGAVFANFTDKSDLFREIMASDMAALTDAMRDAAAKGRVSFVVHRQGYGNCVEIEHGNGLMTRYAHMSAFHSRIGQPVKAGDLIGAIGSSGRSTGPHLHFEVRINDRPVNPRPFLEAAPHVLEEARIDHPGGR